MPEQPLVIQTEHLDEDAAAWLASRCRYLRCDSSDPRFPDLLREADGLVIRTYTLVTPEFLAGAPRLKVIGRAGVGLDNVDVPACAARGIRVVSTPDANTRAVVELVMAFMLDATRPRVFLDCALPAPEWKASREQQKARRQLCELTLGIWGMGRIGKRLAQAATALDMRVIYHDLLEIPERQRWGGEPVSADELCARADILTLHVDGRASNRGLVSAPVLARCKDDVVLINTSRGFVVEPAALAAFMRAHPHAQAILDVHEPEPFGPDYPLLGLPNVRLSAHIASATRLAHRNMSWVVRDVWRVLNNEEPEFPATPDTPA